MKSTPTLRPCPNQPFYHHHHHHCPTGSITTTSYTSDHTTSHCNLNHDLIKLTLKQKQKKNSISLLSSWLLFPLTVFASVGSWVDCVRLWVELRLQNMAAVDGWATLQTAVWGGIWVGFVNVRIWGSLIGTCSGFCFNSCLVLGFGCLFLWKMFLGKFLLWKRLNFACRFGEILLFILRS